MPITFRQDAHYSPFLVYCRELAPGTVSLTDDRAQGDDSKHDSHYIRTDLDWLQSLKQIFINAPYHILVASLTLMAL